MSPQINNMLSKIMGVITIIIALSMLGNIYDANAAIGTAITVAVNAASFLILPDLLPFGAILIPILLIFAGGMLAWKGSMDSGVKQMLATIFSIVGVIMILSFFPNIIDQLDGVLTTAIAAGDTISELFYGTILPLLLYIVIGIAPVALTGYNYVKGRKGSKKAKTASALAY